MMMTPADVPGTVLVRVKVGPWRWRLVKAPDLSTAARHVALTLAVHMDELGSINPRYRPSIETLANECRRNKHTVLSAIDELSAKGWLHVDKGEGRQPNDYQAVVVVPGGAPLPEGLVVPIQTVVVPIQTRSGARLGTHSAHQHISKGVEASRGAGEAGSASTPEKDSDTNDVDEVTPPVPPKLPGETMKQYLERITQEEVTAP
jgi:DNA-binding transcriptional MocR family regulator